MEETEIGEVTEILCEYGEFEAHPMRYVARKILYLVAGWNEGLGILWNQA